jgi:hypothetical protein
METLAFWEHVYKNGQMARALLFLASSLLFLLLLAYVLGGSFGGAPGSFSYPVLSIGVILIALVIFFYPTMPRSYRTQFKGKFRSDIPEVELNGLLVEMTEKSLELTAIIVDAVCVLCIMVYAAGKLFSLPDNITLILLVATAIDTILISLIVGSLGKTNLYYMRMTFTDDEYKRYSRPSNYKRIIALLVLVNVIAAVLLYVA